MQNYIHVPFKHSAILFTVKQSYLSSCTAGVHTVGGLEEELYMTAVCSGNTAFPLLVLSFGYVTLCYIIVQKF